MITSELSPRGLYALRCRRGRKKRLRNAYADWAI